MENRVTRCKVAALVLAVMVALMALMPGALADQAAAIVDPVATQAPVADDAGPEDAQAPLNQSQWGDAQGAVETGSDSEIMKTVELYLFEEDQTLDMPKNSRSFWFEMPKGISPHGKVKLSLHMTHSHTIIDELSSLTIYLNSVPISTRKIVEQGQHSFVWEIEFDGSLITLDGFNELKITTIQRSIEGECADIDNPLNWVVIHNDSKFIIDINMALKPVLKDFYNLFFGSFTRQNTIENDYILGNPMNTQIISTMLEIANAVGMNVAGRQYIDIRVGGPGQLADIGNNRIYIDINGTGGAQTDANLSIQGATGAAPYYSLYLESTSREGLRNATNYLGNSDLVDQTENAQLGLKSVISAKNVRTYAKRKDSGIYTFAEFGYEDVNMAGVFHQSVEYRFVQPEGVRGDVGSYIDVAFRHSDALLSERSLLTIHINGTPIDSVKLTPSNTAGGNLLVNIPAEALLSPEIVVRIDCYHYLGKVDCTKDYYDVAWTLIDAEQSKLFLADAKNVLRPTLTGFPYFHDTSADPKVSFYMPEQPNADRLEIAAMLATRTGQNSGMTFEWNVMDTALSSNTDGNIVVMTHVASQSLPAEVLNRLDVGVENGAYVMNNSELPVIRENLTGKGVIQAITSPWNPLKKIYVIFYDGDEALHNLYSLFEDRSKLDELTGQVALIGKDGSVQAYVTEVRGIVETKVPMRFTDYVKQFESMVGLPIWIVLVFVVVIFVIAGLIVRLVRRKRDDYQEIGNIHKAGQGFEVEDEAEDEGRGS